MLAVECKPTSFAQVGDDVYVFRAPEGWLGIRLSPNPMDADGRPLPVVARGVVTARKGNGNAVVRLIGGKIVV